MVNNITGINPLDLLVGVRTVHRLLCGYHSHDRVFGCSELINKGLGDDGRYDRYFAEVPAEESLQV